MTDKELEKVKENYCKGPMTENEFIAFLWKSLQAEREAHQALKERLKTIEVIEAEGFEFCPACSHSEHKKDCWLANAIKGV